MKQLLQIKNKHDLRKNKLSSPFRNAINAFYSKMTDIYTLFLPLTQIRRHMNQCTNKLKKIIYVKSKGKPRQTEVALGVPDRLRSRIFLMFGTTRVVGRQLNAPAAFTPGEIPGSHFQRLSSPQGTWFCQKEPQKKIPSDTTGDRSQDRPTSSTAP